MRALDGADVVFAGIARQAELIASRQISSTELVDTVHRELHREKDVGMVPQTFTEDIIYEDDGATEPTCGHAGDRAPVHFGVASVSRLPSRTDRWSLYGPGRARFSVWGRISETMTGSLEPPGLAATGTRMSTDFGGFYESDGDRISYARIIINTTELAIQLGASPGRGSSGETLGSAPPAAPGMADEKTQ